jgi:hypothetical protein
MSEPPGGIDNNPIYAGLNTFGQWTSDLYDGRGNGLVLYGPAGIGKTHTAERIAHEKGIAIVKPRPGTARGLIDCLYENADARVIMIDDLDSIWSDETALNTLKVALDSREPRILSHTVASEHYSIEPFEITAKVLFISNKDFNNPKQFSSKVWESGVLPIKSRCAVIGLPFDPVALYEYTGWLASDGGMLKQLYFDLPLANGIHQGNRRRGLSRIETNEVLEHFARNAHRYPSLTPRELYRLARVRIGKSYEEWAAQIEPLLTGEWNDLPDIIPWFTVGDGPCGVSHIREARRTAPNPYVRSRSTAASAASLRELSERV